MIVINSNMLPGDSPRLNLVTSSRDYLDYPLRPNVHRMWGTLQRPRSKWQCCYFPQSFPVYRMQRMISMILCLLVMVLLSVIAFVLVQIVPPPPPPQQQQQQMAQAKSVSPGGDVIESGGVVGSEEDYRKRESGLGLVRTARKLEDHAEYKRSVGDDYSEAEDDYADEEDDDLILNNDGDDEYEEEEDDDGDDNNPVFDMKYFDFSAKARENQIGQDEVDTGEGVDASPAFFATPAIGQKWDDLPKVTVESAFRMDVVEDGVVFSQSVEALLPEPELSDARVGEMQGRMRSGEVTVLQEPTWEKCGRPKNQWLEMASGEAACARYRYPDDCLLVGEVLSFYLSRVLGVGHVPPVVLSQPSGARWQRVAKDMQRAGWGDAPVVVLTPWIPDLVRDHMPSILVNALMEGKTLSAIATDDLPEAGLPNPKDVKTKSSLKKKKKAAERDLLKAKDALVPDQKGLEAEESPQSASAGGVAPPKDIRELSERDLIKLLQWSDLLVFDYLTANYDRVAYMQDAAEKEGRLRVLSGTVHNLVRNTKTDALWLLDNESGLVDAYTLLYGTADPVQSSRFNHFHRQMLESMCIFRRSTMEAILGLHRHPEPHAFLVDFARRHEPLFHLLPDPLKNPLFAKYFPVRVGEVYQWMSACVDKVRGHSNAR
ncbi:uncharacterized protein LOC135204323 [Macrobrachium nipponense]|uniref:uncharacterized protein LOC135204323 n=1 Tax=Macrobrachium nipponense TaxID=159736 RepID=UPI0030C880BE